MKDPRGSLEKHLGEADLDEALRKELETARRKALKGELSDREFHALQRHAGSR